ncbi:MAG: nitroreductase family deazaflavin-dependent oxidoreductase [Dehalococcoidia bacterium]|nr:MAG: nitroreductase family deazaflavin-dependent oxidoreductase [Dehalococcoidia bacterium]
MEDIPPVRPRATGLMRVLVRTPVLLYRLGLGGLIGKHTLLLTTTGRRTGLPRVVPLDYQQEGDTLYLIAEQGTRSPWYRNLVANPEVEVQVGSRKARGVATPLTDPQEKAHVLKLFVRRSTSMAERYYGIPRGTSDEELLQLAPQRAVVAVRPLVS